MHSLDWNLIMVDSILQRKLNMKTGILRTGYTSPKYDNTNTERILLSRNFIGATTKALALVIVFLSAFATNLAIAKDTPTSLEGKTMRFELNSKGQVSSFYNKLTKHEYIYSPGNIWKLIYKEGERLERPVFANNQTFTIKKDKNENGYDRLNLIYKTLKSDDRKLNVSLTISMTMEDDRLSIESSLNNNDTVEIMELHITAASGVQSLSNTPEKDYLAWPHTQGEKKMNPAFSKILHGTTYIARDHIHSDVTLLYPGGGHGSASMSWFGLCNDEEGLYIASHDTTNQTVGLHVEQVTRQNVLRMGIVQYLFVKPNEAWHSSPVVYAVHKGD